MTWVIELARHRQEELGGPTLFGVVIYTGVHANLKKVLRDDDYWAALDELSGPKCAIFSIRAQAAGASALALEPGRDMMVEVSNKLAANRELLSAFGLDSTQVLPMLVVFTLEPTDYLHRIIIPLSDNTPQSAFASLKSALHEITAALDGLSPEMLFNTDACYSAVDHALRRYRNRQRFAQGYRLLKELRDWLPF